MYSRHNEEKHIQNTSKIQKKQQQKRNTHTQLKTWFQYQKVCILTNQMLQSISTYIDSSKENNDKDPKFKIGDIVQIIRYKNIFPKGYTPNLSEEVFKIKKLKNIVPWTYLISDINGEEIAGTFMKNNCKKPNQKEFRTKKEQLREKVINYMLNKKVMKIHLIAGQIKKT